MMNFDFILFGSVRQNMEMSKRGKLINMLIIFCLFTASICISLLTSCNYIESNARHIILENKNCDAALFNYEQVVMISNLSFTVNQPFTFTPNTFNKNNYYFNLQMNDYRNNSEFILTFNTYKSVGDIRELNHNDQGILTVNKNGSVLLQMIPYGATDINLEKLSLYFGVMFNQLNVHDKNIIMYKSTIILNCIDIQNGHFIITISNSTCQKLYNQFKNSSTSINHYITSNTFGNLIFGVSTFCHNCYYINLKQWENKDIQTFFTNTFTLFTTFYAVYSILYLLFYKFFKNKDLDLILQKKIFEMIEKDDSSDQLLLKNISQTRSQI